MLEDDNVLREPFEWRRIIAVGSSIPYEIDKANLQARDMSHLS